MSHDGILRTDGCRMTTTQIPSPNGNPNLIVVIEWPETDLGQNASVPCPCDFSLDTTNLFATRHCGGNFQTGAVWEEPYVSPCNFTVIARTLCRLAQVRYGARVS